MLVPGFRIIRFSVMWSTQLCGVGSQRPPRRRWRRGSCSGCRPGRGSGRGRRTRAAERSVGSRARRSAGRKHSGAVGASFRPVSGRLAAGGGGGGRAAAVARDAGPAVAGGRARLNAASVRGHRRADGRRSAGRKHSGAVGASFRAVSGGRRPRRRIEISTATVRHST
jgi:hypothetical protein